MNKKAIIKAVINSAVSTALVSHYYKKGKSDGFSMGKVTGKTQEARKNTKNVTEAQVDHLFKKIKEADSIKEVLTFNNFVNMAESISEKEKEINKIAEDSSTYSLRDIVKWNEIYSNANPDAVKGVK